jgi:hypothetical protein
MALSRHLSRACQCPLLGVKRTSVDLNEMSAYDTKRIWRTAPGTHVCPFPVSCPVLSLGGGDETARVHHHSQRRGNACKVVSHLSFLIGIMAVCSGSATAIIVKPTVTQEPASHG